MFVGKFGSGKNVYVRLMESYRNEQGKSRTRVIKNFGRYDELIKDNPNAYEELRAKYNEQSKAKTALTVQARKNELEQILNTASAAQSSEASKPAALLSYGHYALRPLWDQDLCLGRKIRYLQKTKTQYRFDLNAAISFLCFMKVIDPASILFRFDNKDAFLGDPAKELSLHNLYHCLDFVKQQKDEIFEWVNSKLDEKFGKSRATMVFYDVTNAYFESELTDGERDYEQADFAENLSLMAQEARARGELPDTCFDEDGNLIADVLPAEFVEAVADSKIQYLKMRGPSKEHRHDLPIVSIAMVIDCNGFPMDFAVYAGNASEFKTMRKSIETFKRKYNIVDVTVSADRGINSVENLKMLRDAGLGFLVAQKVTQFDNVLTEQMLNLDLYTPFDPEHPERGGYLVIENWIKGGKSSKDPVKCTLVLTYNEKRRRRDEAILKAWRSLVEDKMAKGEKLGPRKTGWAALADIGDKQDKAILGVNEAVYQHKLRMCGFAGLVYSPPNDAKVELNIKDLALSYKRQCRIEECFRIMKHNLMLRPMFVWNTDHVRGYIAVCVLALLILRLLQHKLADHGVEMSIDEICATLKGAVVAAIPTTIDGKEDAFFLSCEKPTGLRKGKEGITTEELCELSKAGQLKRRGINQLLKAVELEPLPLIGKRPDVARCLKTRFRKLTDAIPELLLC